MVLMPEWAKWIRDYGSLPKCCYLCFNYNEGVCCHYGEIPEDFRGNITECSEFEFFDGVPF